MKCAVVTGAGTGIGKAAATALLSNGYRVAFAGRRREPLEAAIAQANVPADQALAVPTNVADPASVATNFNGRPSRHVRSLDMVVERLKALDDKRRRGKQAAEAAN